MPRRKDESFSNKLKRKAGDLVENIRGDDKKKQGRSQAEHRTQGNARSASGRQSQQRSAQQRSAQQRGGR